MILQRAIVSSLTTRRRKEREWLPFLFSARITQLSGLVLAILFLFLLSRPPNLEDLNNLKLAKASQLMGGRLQHQGKELFFHFVHTTNEASFHRRSLRAVESVFYHHPNAKIFIHVPQDGVNIGLHSDMTGTSLEPLQKAGYNVTVRPFQLGSLVDAAISLPGSIVKEQRAKRWMRTKILPNFAGSNWYVDVSDLVRLLVLYTQGGMYLDTDIIMVNPVDQVPNSIGFERPGGPSNAVLKFDKGNQFVGDCLNDYFFKYKSSTVSWGYVGPSLLKRVYTHKYKHCEMPALPKTRNQIGTLENCPVYVLWQDAFYPNVDNCFIHTPNTEKKKNHIQEHSFVAHTYNQRTKEALATMNITRMMEEDTLCNWLYHSFCILCEDNVWKT